MKFLWLTALTACVPLITPARVDAQPLFGGAESIECTVLNADAVVVGIFSEIENGADAVTATLAVEVTLKGEHRNRLRVRFPDPGPTLPGAKHRATRLLVATRGDPPAATRVIDLSDQGLEVLTADFNLLKEPEDVVRAARGAIRRMPGVRQIDTFRLVVPARVAAGTHWDQYYRSGGYVTLDVPVDERLEKRAHESIRSKSYMEREEGARALRHFNSDENVARLQSLLADPGWAYMRHAEQNQGVEVRVYGVRTESYRSLKFWGVKVDEPITREEVMKPESVATVDLSNTAVTYAELDALTRFKNIQNIYLRNVPLTDASLKLLVKLQGLRSLDLGGTGVTDAGLKDLAELAELQHMSLRGTKVMGSGLQELAGLKNLASLDLSQTGVTDSGLKQLTGLPGLRDLDLSGSKVSVGGIAELLKLYPDLKVSR